jgi:hypothetical protein
MFKIIRLFLQKSSPILMKIEQIFQVNQIVLIFDAEGIVAYGNDLLIFTKNWSDFKPNVYKTPLATGNYIATKVSAANVDGLITDATYNDDHFFLTGYDTSIIPF